MVKKYLKSVATAMNLTKHNVSLEQLVVNLIMYLNQEPLSLLQKTLEGKRELMRVKCENETKLKLTMSPI